MLITSYSPEHWTFLGRDVDPQTGYERVDVRHQTTERVVVYRLVRYPDAWRKIGDIMPHFKGFRRYPERKGIKLSNSRMDLTLLSFCEAGHGSAYV